MEPEKLQQVSEINILRTELFSEAEENLKRNKDQSVFIWKLLPEVVKVIRQ